MAFQNYRLVALRKEKGYKQTSLASAMGLARSTIAMWEAGRSEPTSDLVAKLAHLLDCSVGYLMGTEEDINAQRKLEQIRAASLANTKKKFDALMSKKDDAQQAREELADDPDRKALLDFARYGTAQEVRAVVSLIDTFRATNSDEYDGDDPA